MKALLEALQIRVVAASQLPAGYRPLTYPIRLEDEYMIRSIWMTLQYAPDAIATVDEGMIQFWRCKSPKLRKGDRGTVEEGGSGLAGVRIDDPRNDPSAFTTG